MIKEICGKVFLFHFMRIDTAQMFEAKITFLDLSSCLVSSGDQ